MSGMGIPYVLVKAVARASFSAGPSFFVTKAFVDTLLMAKITNVDRECRAIFLPASHLSRIISDL